MLFYRVGYECTLGLGPAPRNSQCVKSDKHPHRDRVVSSGAHRPGCVDALHPARAAGAAVWAAHGSSERAASHEIGAARVAPCLQDVAVHEGNWVQWYVCGGHHLPLEAGLEPLLLF